ncbi:oligoribonuclease [Bdellovibrio bacteriovorus]|uniref:Oligoribonuclease n=1 Tax=Bdellovibrio bacteriovorus TaxID=959 RepID=A0A150WU96_BDEBC|nr:oligoribonuclease [Bdellovibrio bacteriovorus]KYG62879.1 oligoribonuclease [Bdellovibrio bacteriovorus]KYG70170.1 oligoribonuclease [Bdellovibrio bacteriovorus]
MNKLFWLDMEMTGLDVEKEVIIEVAAIVTDLNFKELDTFETVVKQPQKYLDNMDAWNTEHHKKSGLTAKVPFGMEPDQVEAKLVDMVKKHFPDPKDRPILAGNSIMQDRLFIDKYMKDLAPRLHYRMVDVSSWKVIINNKFNYVYQKANKHRALDDIRESIQELRAYCDKMTFNK